MKRIGGVQKKPPSKKARKEARRYADSHFLVIIGGTKDILQTLHLVLKADARALTNLALTCRYLLYMHAVSPHTIPSRCGNYSCSVNTFFKVPQMIKRYGPHTLSNYYKYIYWLLFDGPPPDLEAIDPSQEEQMKLIRTVLEEWRSCLACSKKVCGNCIEQGLCPPCLRRREGKKIIKYWKLF
jgi:hypothetical protein